MDEEKVRNEASQRKEVSWIPMSPRDLNWIFWSPVSFTLGRFYRVSVLSCIQAYGLHEPSSGKTAEPGEFCVCTDL